MALELDLKDTDLGIPAPRAYRRICGMFIGRGASGIDVTIDTETFFSKPASPATKALGFARATCKLSDLPVGADPIQSAYLWLKTRPENAAGKDV